MPEIVKRDGVELVIGMSRHNGEPTVVSLDRLALVWLLDERYGLGPNGLEKLRTGQTVNGLSPDDLAGLTLEEIGAYLPTRMAFEFEKHLDPKLIEENPQAKKMKSVVQKIRERKEALERAN